MTKIDKLIVKELERKQIDLFARGHQGRQKTRRDIQLIEAQDTLKRRGRVQGKPKTRR